MLLTLRRLIILVLIPAILSSAVWSATAIGAAIDDRSTNMSEQTPSTSKGGADLDDTADHCTHACHSLSHFLGMVTMATTVHTPTLEAAPAWHARAHRPPSLKHQLPPPRV